MPFPPGGSNDIVGRMVGQQLGERLGQSVVIDNRGGAGGTIGTDMAAKAPPDGYTLLLISVAHAFNPAIYKKLPYDPEKAFAPIGMVAAGPVALTVHPSVPVHSVAGADRAGEGEARASSTTPPPASAASSTWRASCSSCRPASTWCTSRTRAAGRR